MTSVITEFFLGHVITELVVTNEIMISQNIEQNPRPQSTEKSARPGSKLYDSKKKIVIKYVNNEVAMVPINIRSEWLTWLLSAGFVVSDSKEPGGKKKGTMLESKHIKHMLSMVVKGGKAAYISFFAVCVLKTWVVRTGGIALTSLLLVA